MARINRNKVMEAARKHQARGQYDKAIAQYRKLVDADPRDVRSLLKIGDLQVRKGDKPNAVETYQRVANHYGQQGFFLKAIAVYKQILKLEPSRLDVQMMLGDMYEQLQLLSDAMSVYEEVAAAYMRAGDLDRALSTLGRIVELDPEHIPVRIKYAEALSRAGRSDQAANEFAEGARLLKEQGRLDDYVKVAERLLYHRGNDVEVARDLAETYLERRDAKRALTKLQVCFKADPRDVATLGLLAEAFLQLGQREKAISVYREVARVHREAQQPKERTAALQKILELDPSDAQARESLARDGGASGRQLMPEPVAQEAKAPDPADTSQASGIIYVDEEIDESDDVVVDASDAADESDVAEIQEVSDVAALPTGYEETEVGSVPPQDQVAGPSSVAPTTQGRAYSPMMSDPPAAFPRPTSGQPPAAAANFVGSLEPITFAQFESIPMSGAAAVAVPYSPSPMEAALEQADLLLTYGQFDDAKAVIAEIQSYAAQHPLVLDKANEIVALAALHASEVASAAPPPASVRPVSVRPASVRPASVAPPVAPPAVVSQEPLAPSPVMTMPGGAPVSSDVEVLEDESFAFAEKLAEELAEVAPAHPTAEGAETIDVDAVFEQFKAGVAEQIDDDDSSTHLDLGIAYKEMGLLPDARREFQVAMQDPQKRCLCWTMIGLCYLAEGRPHDAVEAFQSGLETEQKTDNEEVGLYYELANACELAGKDDQARLYFEHVCRREPTFRDAEQRLQKLGGPTDDGVDEAMLESVDDVNRAFDRLILDDN